MQQPPLAPMLITRAYYHHAVKGLIHFADTFFAGVDEDTCNEGINNVGVFRVDNNVHSGFDTNVNDEGKMQVLFGLLMPDANNNGNDPTMLPMEVGDVVGTKSMSAGHDGMRTLFDVSKQITSAVLDMDKDSSTKIIDDCTTLGHCDGDSTIMHWTNADNLSDQISNSYQRLIRYFQPNQPETNEKDGEQFWPHVDSTFLTVIPLPDKPGLQLWAPSLVDSKHSDLSKRGEWVAPIRPADQNVDDVYVVALAGEFLQLLSNGRVPACIHRVMPMSFGSTGFTAGLNNNNKPRISAPLFVRPRRTEGAILNIEEDLDQGKHICGNITSVMRFGNL